MNNWIMGRRWNIVQTIPNNESLAATSAKEMGWQVFWPRYRTTRIRPHRRPLKVVLPYIPGYIFVADDKYLSLWDLSKAKGVTTVLRMGSEFAFVNDTDRIMQALLKMADDEGFVTMEVAKKPITLFKAGDKVKFKDDLFSGFPAIVANISKNHKVAEVWATIFGRPTLLKVETVKLKKVAA